MMSYQLYQKRRENLVNRIREAHPNQNGLVVLFAGFESELYRFLQESSFYYFTGLKEASVVLTIDMQGQTKLYVPNCLAERSKWVTLTLDTSEASAKKIGVDKITALGHECPSYQMYPCFPKEQVAHLLDDLHAALKGSDKLFVLAPSDASGYIEQRAVLQRLQSFGLSHEVVDISLIVAQMRRTKDMQEMEELFRAVEITCLAQEAAARAIVNGMHEAEVQASLEYIIVGSGGQPSFPSIVGSGKNATVLHYNENSDVMKNGDLVVVDIGARYNQYCADITRTYPVSGTFTPRQKEIYSIVLETQNYIAEKARPGVWLSNAEKPEESLNHLAKEFIKSKGYGDYFPHGIGHYLGLDVHDVGDYKEPLKVGDVITIEPGIYIPEERIGVRIEDNYWIVKDGVICLSEALPKSISEVEQMVQEQFEK